MPANATAIDVDVPPGESPEATCPYCERPFRSERARDLHVGEAHEDVASDDELTAHEEALEAERDDLFFYHLKVVIGLGVVYAITVIAYMVVLSGNFV